MAIDYIRNEAYKLINKYHTRNPFELADETGVQVVFMDIGAMKGMYSLIKRNRFIVLSDALDEYEQMLVCAHELGHDRLHREFAKDASLREFMLYDMSSRPEYEANIFAAEIMLPDENIVKLSKRGYDAEQIARALYTDTNLVALKLSSMTQRGYSFTDTYYSYRANFLK